MTAGHLKGISVERLTDGVLVVFYMATEGDEPDKTITLHMQPSNALALGTELCGAAFRLADVEREQPTTNDPRRDSL